MPHGPLGEQRKMKKNVERNQLIITLAVVFVALTALSVFTISTFSKKSRADAVSLGQSLMIQEREQVSAYMTGALDSVRSAAINIELMLKQKDGNQKILKTRHAITPNTSMKISPGYTGLSMENI